MVRFWSVSKLTHLEALYDAKVVADALAGGRPIDFLGLSGLRRDTGILQDVKLFGWQMTMQNANP
jgi:hypothetical protein